MFSPFSDYLDYGDGQECLVSKARSEFAQDFMPLMNGSCTTTSSSNASLSASTCYTNQYHCKTSTTTNGDQNNLQSLKKDSVKDDVSSTRKDNHTESQYQDPTPEYTFTLPDLSIHPTDFSVFLEKDLIEKSSLTALEGAGRLNWWTDIGLCQKLWPLATTGDGNCLLHAASLGIWGFHDRLLTLRKALYSLLSSSSLSDAFYRRWRLQSSRQNQAAGLILCEDEWIKEWKSLMQMASTQPRTRHLNSEPTVTSSSDKQSLNGEKKTPDQEGLKEQLDNRKSAELLSEGTSHVYESLEEIHILALAHVLRRPIIVVADTVLKDVTGEPFAPIPFGGVYLPLEFSPSDCHQSPLCLTYDSAHFSALVPMDRESFVDESSASSINTSSSSTSGKKIPTAIPLVDPNDSLLAIQFAVDPGSQVDWDQLDASTEGNATVKDMTHEEKIALLKSYLDVLQLKATNVRPKRAEQAKVTVTDSPSKSSTLPAKLDKKDEEASVTKARSNSASDTVNRSCSPLDTHGLRKRMMKWMRLSTLRSSMSKKLRKNWQLAKKRGTSFRFKRRRRITDESNQAVHDSNPAASTVENNDPNQQHHEGLYYCARLHTEKRHDYQDEMIRNYLSTARLRFKDEEKKKDTSSSSTSAKKITSPRSSTSSSGSSTLSDNSSTSVGKEEDDDCHYASQCVSEGCKNYGTASTSYLCTSCFADQKEEMKKKEAEVRKSPVKISDALTSIVKSEEGDKLEKLLGSNEELEKQESLGNNKDLRSLPAKRVSTTNGHIIGC